MNDCICFRNSLWTGKTVGEEGIKKGRKQCSVTETGGSFVINIFCQAEFLLIQTGVYVGFVVDLQSDKGL